MLRRKLMATANSISKKIVGYLKPLVEAALQGMSKEDMDDIEIAMDAFHTALVNDDTSGVESLLVNLDADKTFAFMAGISERIDEEFDREDLKQRFQEKVEPLLEKKFGRARRKFLNTMTLEHFRGMKGYSMFPSHRKGMDEVLASISLNLEPGEFQEQVEEKITAFAEKVKIGNPFQHEDVDGESTTSNSSEEGDDSTPKPPGGPDGGGNSPDDDSRRNIMSDINADKVKAALAANPATSDYALSDKVEKGNLLIVDEAKLREDARKPEKVL